MENNKIYDTEEKIIGITSKCAYCNSYMITDSIGSYCEKQCEGVKEEKRLSDEVKSLIEKLDKATTKYRNYKSNAGK